MDIRTPESMGLSSKVIENYLKSLDAAHLVTHDIIIARGDSILFETYVPPFTAGDTHRMYSVSKSIVSLAVGFALDDGLLSLDDPVDKYFAKELEGQTDENFRHMTVRNMLMMATAKHPQNWFAARTDDRVRYYFQNPTAFTRTPGTMFEYDSTGSFVVGALIERLTGMKFMDYLRGKLFDKIGVSEKAHCLTCPGGHSWGDSACLMTPRDLLLCARFTLNGGSWEGKQLVSADYIREATSCLISTDEGKGIVSDSGYGYYIWKTFGEGFFFNGMGCQFAVCVPEKDMILIYNGDNQGIEGAIVPIIHGFFEQIIPAVSDAALPDDPAAQASLASYANGMKLTAAWMEKTSPMAQKVSGVTYTLNENPMGMTEFTLTLDGAEGNFSYHNAQGDKSFAFGMGENRFGVFPQDGYSKEIGSVPGDERYRCAASAAWKTPDTLYMKVQLMSDYFGNFDAYFTFSEDGKTVSVSMEKHAEDFLSEYNGSASGTAKRS